MMMELIFKQRIDKFFLTSDRIGRVLVNYHKLERVNYYELETTVNVWRFVSRG